MAEKPFSKSFWFLHSFSTNFLVLYMVTGATPLTHGTLYFFFSILLAINEGNIFILHWITHCNSLCHKHTAFSLPLSLTLYDINTPASHSC